MNNKAILLGVVAVVFIGGALLLANKSSQTNNASTATTQMEAAPTTATNSAAAGMDKSAGESMASDEQTFTVTASEFKYDVSEMKVKKGTKVTIVFKNAEGFHDWVLDEFKAKTKQIKEGESETISFVADTAGTFEYYCSVGKHRQMGMVGKLIVE